MLGRPLKVGGVLLIVAGAAAAAWFAGMRAKASVVVTTQRRVNKAVFNPRQLRTAGQPGAYASVIRHTGRSSGRAYQTPVGAVPTDDGFAIALMYGPRSDWVRNVLASRSATLVHEGETVEVGDPEVVPFDTAARHFDDGTRRSVRLFGVQQVLLVRRVGTAPASAARWS